MIIFFFKQKTAYEMRISDWSSDVCSSDLKNLSCHIVDCGEITICRRLLCRTFVPCYFAVQSIEESAWTTARRADPVSLGEMSRAVEMPGLGKGSEMTSVAARRRPLARHLAVAFCSIALARRSEARGAGNEGVGTWGYRWLPSI